MRLLIILFLFLSLNFAKAGIVEPVYKQLKDPQDGGTNTPSTVSIQITPDGTKMFVLDHLEESGRGKIYIYNLTTPFDISTMDVDNRTIVNTHDKGDAFTVNNSNNDIEFNNDGTKMFLFSEYGQMLAHNLPSPYDVASISASTLIPDDGLDYNTAYGTVSSIKGVTFNNDGTKMYLNDGTNTSTDITQVNLSTPFDPSSGTFAYNLNTESITARYTMDLAFDDDGTRLYLSESGTSVATNYMYVWKLSDPFNLESATFVDKWPIKGNGNNLSPYAWTFGNNGMKLYIGTEDASSDGDDIIYEYDLTCPYGIVLCETDSISSVGAQAEFAKHVIQENTSTLFKRFEWLRRNEGKNNLNNLTASIKLDNPLLNYWIKKFPTKIVSVNGAVENGRSITIGHENKNTNNLDNFTTVIKSDNPSLNSWMNKLPKKITALRAFLKEKSIKDKKTIKTKNKNWAYWSHGDISFGRKGDTATSKPNEIRVSGIMFGADKKINNNKFFGAAIRFGKGEIENITPNGIELDTESLSFNLYSTLPVNNNSNLNALLGVSLLRIDQLLSKKTTGERNGKQFFTAINIQSKDSYGNYNLRPTGTFEFGVTQFSEYTDFGTSSTNSQDSYDSLTFKTGNIAAGFKFDNFMDINNGRLSRNGSLEYVQDLTSNIDYNFKNNSANASTTKTVETHSIHNIKGNFGFEILYESGYTFALNYERFQGLDYSSHQDSIFIKFGHIREEDSDFALNYKPLENNQMELSYVKDINGFDVKVSSNYSLMNEIPDYGANIEVSSMF